MRNVEREERAEVIERESLRVEVPAWEDQAVVAEVVGADVGDGERVGVDVGVGAIVEKMAGVHAVMAKAQEAFLRVAEANRRAMAEAMAFQMALVERAGAEGGDVSILEGGWSGGGVGGGSTGFSDGHAQGYLSESGMPADSEENERENGPALDREMCLEFAVGSIGRVLGEAFAHVDGYPTRVRLPDEPLILVDRIVEIEGEANGLVRVTEGGLKEKVGGRVVTEHDIHPDAWYLDANRIPTCIAVEAGQADLFLSGYLGIDSITKGCAVYRLLDAVVTFHRGLPRPGERIVYDIVIEEFFRQGATHLFRFGFEATVRGERFLSMTKGCAGFFTEGELAAGQGIVLTAMDKRAVAGKRPADWVELVPMGIERYSDEQLEMLRAGDLAGCFGEAFAGLAVERASTLPGGNGGRMKLVHRILKLDPTGGRYGIGQITGEADIRADDWFLTCHFVDDRVMPGTLMYECCLHTLRVYLMRMGWVGEEGAVAYEPVPGVASQLKCRGQVTEGTGKVQYEVTLKEIGYAEDGTPFVIADALMYGDGRAIVQMTNMSVRLSGLTRGRVEELWKTENREPKTEKTVLFDTPRITAFAVGRPSEAFGEPYLKFDPGEVRKIARLPGPPYQFWDRIVSIEGCGAFKLAAGGVIEAEYDVPAGEWYFAAKDQRAESGSTTGEMPFSVLLEVALQPCGWLAAYLGSGAWSVMWICGFAILAGRRRSFAR